MLNLYLKRSITIFTLLAVTLLSHGVQAQDTSVKGIVQDSYGNAIESVNVSVEGQETSTVTNAEGQFEIQASSSSVLVFTHPDYATFEFVTGQNNDLVISLTERYLQSPEILPVLYGEKDRKSMLGATSTVYTDQINTTLSPNYAAALSGRMPGLYVQQYRGIRNTYTSGNTNSDLVGQVPQTNNAVPTDNTMFALSLRGQGPVTVIDGIQRDIYSIDPENIESISVQKDALSSILLGMRSSRGLVLVNTRKPEADRFQLSFSGEIGVQTPLNMPKPLPTNQYAYLLNEALLNDGQTAAYTDEDFQAFRDGTSPYTHPNVNWYNQVLKKNAPISTYNLNVNGGGKVARYSLSLNYLNQEGLFKTSDINSYNTNLELNRYLFTSSVAVDVTDDFEVGVTLFGRVQEGNQPGAGTGAILSGLVNTPGSAYPVYNEDDSYAGNVSFPVNLYAQTINSGYIQDNSRDIMANVELNYDLGDFVEGLSVKGVTNMSTQNLTAIVRNKQNTVYEYTPPTEENAGSYSPYGSNIPQSNSFVNVASTRFWYGQLSLNYEKQVGKHNLGAMIFGDKRIVSVNYDLPAKSNNVAAKVNYDYDGKYFAEAAIDFNSFNRYPTDDQWGTFYAFGLGWDISKEDFLSSKDWLNQLKIRGVYGKTGNGIDNSGYYIWRQTYRTTVLEGTYPQGYSRGPGNGEAPNGLANPNISWEKANKLNIGADVAVMDNHLQFTADYYYDKYYDLLQIRGKSIALMGLAYPVENIGENLYKGLELSLTYQNNLGNFNYFVTGNWSRMETEVLFIDEQFREFDYTRQTGRPVGTIFGLETDGFFNSQEEIANSATFDGIEVQPGDIKYKDMNNDGVIDINDIQPIGNTKPLSYYGITAGFNYKGFEVSALLQGAYNRDIYVADLAMQAGFQTAGQSYGQAYEPIIGRWTPETAEIATYPRLSAGRNVNNAPDYNTSFFVHSGDYFRLKNLSIAYTLPHQWFRNKSVSEVKLFMNGQNLFTEAAYDQVDPEVTSFYNYPIQKVISGGIKIKL